LAAEQSIIRIDVLKKSRTNFSDIIHSFIYLPGNSAHDFKSTSLTYVESFASLQIDNKCLEMGDELFRLTQPLIVKFSLPLSSSGVRTVVGFF
jgi:hypothetical protein